MSEKRDSLEQFIRDEMKREAENITKEVDRSHPQAMPQDLKAKIKAQLDQQIEAYEKERLYAQLSEEDQEALALGKKLLEQQKEEQKEDTVATYKKKPAKLYVAFVAAVVLVLAMGITSIGGPERVLQKMGLKIGDREVEKINSSDENLVMDENNEDTAYQEIEDVFGVVPVRILDRTNPIRFTSYAIDKDMQVAELYYTYKEEKVLYWIGAIYKDASWGIDIEDTVVEEYTIEKEGQKIVIKEYEIAETKMKRYSAQFSYNGLEYFLMGAIEKEDFEYLIKNLKFF